jgi:ABC-type bacteriocin/lantibiotic exporter with double-glycine peptidase domain
MSLRKWIALPPTALSLFIRYNHLEKYYICEIYNTHYPVMYTSFSNDDKSSMDSKTPPTFAPHSNATGVQEDDLSEKKHENQDNSEENIVYNILYKYFNSEKYVLLSIIALIISINVLQTNVISSITSAIIDAVEHHQYTLAMDQYKYFIGASILYFFLFSANELFQLQLLTKLTPWLRMELFTHIIRLNTENLTQQNVIKYNSPIKRVSVSAASILNIFISNILSNGAFILIITGYFLIKNTTLGLIFLVLNAVLLTYVAYTWDDTMQAKNIYEAHLNQNELEVIDLFNNFDKIIYRGQSESVINTYSERVSECITKAMNFYNQTTQNQLTMMAMIYIIIFSGIWQLIHSKMSNAIDTKTFITFMTILLLYRDKLSGLLQMIPNFMEFNSRVEYALKNLKDISTNPSDSSVSIYNPIDLSFNKIEFVDVSYKYNQTSKYIFKDLNLTINTDQRIVGITGISGKGKSTIIKLLLKLYKEYDGQIFIDGVDVKTISPEYIRQNITYVNQTAKLFDKPIIENMLYGCRNTTDCNKYLEMILKYPMIQELYKNVDIYSKNVGLLGESLSGGQRQIVNILSGLINPSPILVLDEPTNALDLNLKKELLDIINTFKEYKKCIIIITHDRDVYPLFDKRIRI